MPEIHWRFRLRAVAALLVGSILALTATLTFLAPALGQEPPYIGATCAYQEAGAAGPQGNVLRVVDEDGFNTLILYRDGDRIRVLSAALAFSYSSGVTEVPCTGTPATVTNIDRIEIEPSQFGTHAITVDQSGARIPLEDGSAVEANPGGPLAPGATAEAEGSEIEVAVTRGPLTENDFTPGLWFAGNRSRDSVTGGRVAGGGVGLNLDVRADGSHPDIDVTGGPGSHGIALRGGDGDDRLSAQGGRGFAGGLWKKAFVRLNGGDGDDVLLGHPGLDQMNGARGKDLLRGGRGNDGNVGAGGLNDGPGRDTVYAGPGNDEIGDPGTAPSGRDRIFGGPGSDTFFERDGVRDLLNCGPGREGDVQFDRRDVLKSCTARHYQRPR